MNGKLEFLVNVKWRITQLPSGEYMGECDQLNLVLDAKDFEELKSIIHEGIHGLFVDLIQEDELDEFLQNLGWQKHTYNFARPPSNDNLELRIPMEYIMAEQVRDLARISH